MGPEIGSKIGARAGSSIKKPEQDASFSTKGEEGEYFITVPLL